MNHLEQPNGNTSSTVRKALDILECVATSASGMTLAHITRATELNKATTVRLCATLEDAGFLERDSHMVYRLGRRVWQLGQVYRQQYGFEDIVRPMVAALRDATGESASFYVREGAERVCLIRENSRHIVRHHVDEGARFDVAHGVVGRVLLAFSGAPGAEMEGIRKAGHLSAGGREPDTASVAAPVLDGGGQLIGAVVVSGPLSRFDEAQQAAALELVLATCRSMEAALPGRPGTGSREARDPPRRRAGRTARAEARGE
ncbi:IclR family transcriptional regulator [Roseomonas chloroacetimidivorans]|uniref:IclR family transcriptional regulator n=1 Tax=Roseomonas chloroacetimidivorans TaxID=1766656 RepID=UPI003C77DA3B